MESYEEFVEKFKSKRKLTAKKRRQARKRPQKTKKKILKKQQKPGNPAKSCLVKRKKIKRTRR